MRYIVGVVNGTVHKDNRIDSAALSLLIVTGHATRVLVAPQLPCRVAFIEMVGFQLRLDDLWAERSQQSEQIQAINDLMALVLPEGERNHLLNLHRGTATSYVGNHDVRDSPRTLRRLNLLTRSKSIGATMRDAQTVDLHDFIHLTPRGRPWTRRIAQFDTIPARDAAGEDDGPPG